MDAAGFRRANDQAGAEDASGAAAETCQTHGQVHGDSVAGSLGRRAWAWDLLPTSGAEPEPSEDTGDSVSRFSVSLRNPGEGEGVGFSTAVHRDEHGSHVVNRSGVATIWLWSNVIAHECTGTVFGA